jgi:hypothetical protein
MERYKDYEYEVTDISQANDDFKKWKYKIKNSRTGVEFNYVIKITKTALNCDPRGLMSPIYELVTSKGKYVVQKWLDNGKEFEFGVFVDVTRFELF